MIDLIRESAMFVFVALLLTCSYHTFLLSAFFEEYRECKLKAHKNRFKVKKVAVPAPVAVVAEA